MSDDNRNEPKDQIKERALNDLPSEAEIDAALASVDHHPEQPFVKDARLVGVVGHDDSDEAVRARDEALIRAAQQKLSYGVLKRAGVKAVNFTKAAMIGAGVVFLGLLVAGGIVGYKHIEKDEFYTGRLTDERSCRVQVGNKYVLGRRYYTYRFTDVLGFRLIQKDKVDERTEMFVQGSGYTIVGFDADGKAWNSNVGEGEVGVEPLDWTTTYTIFSDNQVGVISYTDFCNGDFKQHPYATLTD